MGFFEDYEKVRPADKKVVKKAEPDTELVGAEPDTEPGTEPVGAEPDTEPGTEPVGAEPVES